MLYRRKPLKKKRRLSIGYDSYEEVFYIESKSRHGFYHEVFKLNDNNEYSCNCEAKSKGNDYTNNCRHIRVLKYYLKNEWWLIDQVISLPIMLLSRQRQLQQEV